MAISAARAPHLLPLVACTERVIRRIISLPPQYDATMRNLWHYHPIMRSDAASAAM